MARKAYLDSLPRCEVPGCGMRGTLTVAGVALMCGRHFKRAEAEHQRRTPGIFGLFAMDRTTRETVLKLAQA